MEKYANILHDERPNSVVKSFHLRNPQLFFQLK